MIIDSHVHLGTKANSVKDLLDAADAIGIDKLVIFSGDVDCERNADVLAASRAHPDRFIPFAWFVLGMHRPEAIDEAADQGFRGVKFIYPRDAYNDLRYYPVYERCAGHGLPGLFHTGIVARSDEDALMDVDTERMKPIKLDRVLRRFPDWNVIMAHMGNPWHDEAAMMLRWNRNLYSDLSGSTLRYRSPAYLKSLLWWGDDPVYKDALGRGAFEKIVFGTDVSPARMAGVHADYQALFDALGLSREIRADIMGGIMAKLLGLGEKGYFA